MGKALGTDNREKLANYIISYLNDSAINDLNKKYIKEILNNEKIKFENNQMSGSTGPFGRSV